jgi:hypothetical protein
MANDDKVPYPVRSGGHALTPGQRVLAGARFVDHPDPRARARLSTRHVHLGWVDSHPTEGGLAALYHARCDDCGKLLDGHTVTLRDGHTDPDGALAGYACDGCTATRRRLAHAAHEAAAAADAVHRARNLATYGVEDPTDAQRDAKIAELVDLVARLPAAKGPAK